MKWFRKDAAPAKVSYARPVSEYKGAFDGQIYQTKTAVVLGAGAMGAAITTPLCDKGWDVRLWGTSYDDEVLDIVAEGLPHPRTKMVLPTGAKVFRSEQLAEALQGADVVVLAVGSVGVMPVLRKVLPYLDGVESLWITTKGVVVDEGVVRFIPDLIRLEAQRMGRPLPPVVGVGGPVLAYECAAGQPTATVFACHDLDLVRGYSKQLSSNSYLINATADEVGVEACAVLKNVYAIAVGIAAGLSQESVLSFNNFKAAVFQRSIDELASLVEALGGERATAYGLAGIGDLEVTGSAGRNRKFGELVGRGINVVAATRQMEEQQITVEGIPAAAFMWTYIQDHAPVMCDRLPLLQAVKRILAGEGPVLSLLQEAVMSPYLD